MIIVGIETGDRLRTVLRISPGAVSEIETKHGQEKLRFHIYYSRL